MPHFLSVTTVFTCTLEFIFVVKNAGNILAIFLIHIMVKGLVNVEDTTLNINFYIKIKIYMYDFSFEALI